MPEFGQIGALEAGLIWAIYMLIVLVVILRDTGKMLHKILWTLIVIFFPCIGFIIYLFIGRMTHNLGRDA